MVGEDQNLELSGRPAFLMHIQGSSDELPFFVPLQNSNRRTPSPKGHHQTPWQRRSILALAMHAMFLIDDRPRHRSRITAKYFEIDSSLCLQPPNRKLASMSTAPTEDRIRQIAILISVVDSAAAQQLLRHLPTAAAQRVLTMARNLGPISPEEKRKVLAAFQNSATNQPGASSPATSPAANSASVRNISGSAGHGAHSAAYSSSGSTVSGGPLAPPATGQSAVENANFTDVDRGQGSHAAKTHRGNLEESGSQASSPWAGLSTDALLRFVRGERTAVIAVVVSQLPPTTAVEILKELGTKISCDVIRRLSQMEKIDPEAKAALDAHLEESLGKYQQTLESELENTRRLEALFGLAPEELRNEWQNTLDGKPIPQIRVVRRGSLAGSTANPNILSETDVQPTLAGLDPTELPSKTPPTDVGSEEKVHLSPASLPSESPGVPQTLDEIYGNAAITTAQVGTSTSWDSHDSEARNVLEFPKSKIDSTVDQSLIQLEFERVLELPPAALANLLSNTDSQTVLLALAGASPAFMTRFSAMLDRRDARALAKRLQTIGPINMRDIDEAQRLVVENALALTNDGLASDLTKQAA